MVVLVVVFMELNNETARRQTWTTEPVICAIIMGDWRKYGQMVETMMEK